MPSEQEGGSDEGVPSRPQAWVPGRKPRAVMMDAADNRVNFILSTGGQRRCRRGIPSLALLYPTSAKNIPLNDGKRVGLSDSNKGLDDTPFSNRRRRGGDSRVPSRSACQRCVPGVNAGARLWWIQEPRLSTNTNVRGESFQVTSSGFFRAVAPGFLEQKRRGVVRGHSDGDGETEVDRYTNLMAFQRPDLAASAMWN